MTDITIPREALQRAWETYLLDGCGPHAFEAACLAMLRNWPGMRKSEDYVHSSQPFAIILPLTENTNDKG